MKNTSKLYTFFVLCLALLMLGCSAKEWQFSSLLNQGILPVSSENPYNGSNLFLSKQMEESSYLYNFFKGRGAPQAIALTGRSESALEAKFFYVREREVYIGTPHTEDNYSSDKKKETEWIVRGPFALNREDYRMVAKLPAEDFGVFDIMGTRQSFSPNKSSVNHTSSTVLHPVFVPTSHPTPKPRPHYKPVIKASTVPVATVAPTPLNFDQQAILESRVRGSVTTAPVLPTSAASASAKEPEIKNALPSASTDSAEAALAKKDSKGESVNKTAEHSAEQKESEKAPHH